MDLAVAKVKARVEVEGADQFQSDLNKSGSGVEEFSKKMNDAGKKLTLGVTTPLLAFGTASFMTFSNINENMSKVGVIFGDAKNAIVDWSKTTSDSIGQSQQASLIAMGNLGNLFKSTGVDANNLGINVGALAGDLTGLSADMLNNMDPAQALSTGMVTLASDMASFNDASPEEVLAAIQSGLIGESEPLRKFGILLTDAKVNAKAMELGLVDANGEVTEAGKVQARYALIMEESATSHGDFGETADSASNKLRTLRANISDLSAKIGEVLYPIVSKIISGMITFIDKLQGVSPVMLKVGIVIGVLAAALGPILIIVGQVAAGLSALGPVMAVLTGPIGLIILALAALGIAYKTNFLGFGDAVDSIAGKIKNFVDTFMLMFGFYDAFDGVSKIQAAFMSLGVTLSVITGYDLNGFFRAFGDGIQRPVDAIMKMVDGIKQIATALLQGDWSGALAGLKKTMAGLGDFLASPAKLIGKLLQNITTGFKPLDSVIHRIGGIIVSFGRLFQEIFQGDIKGAIEVVMHMFDQFVGLAESVWNLLKAVFNSIDWGAVWNRLKDAAVLAFEAVKTAVQFYIDTYIAIFKAIPWDTVWEILKVAAAKAFEALKEIASATIDGLIEVFNAIPWGAIWDVLKTSASAAFDFVSGLISQINWGAIADGLASFATGAWEAIQSGLKLAWDAITSLDWSKFIDKIEDFAGIVVTAVGNLPWGDMLGAAIDFAGTVLTAIGKLPWGDMLGAAIDFASTVVTAIGNLPWDTMLGTAIDFAGTVVTAIGSLPWGDMLGAAIDFASTVTSAIGRLDWHQYITSAGNLATLLGEKITNLDWASFVTKVTDFGMTLSQKVQNLDWSTIISKVTDFATMIGPKIAQLYWDIFIPRIVWSTFIRNLDWHIFIPSISWAEWLVKLSWKLFLPNFLWSNFLSKIDWRSLIGHFPGWAEYIAKLSWRLFLPNFLWSTFLSKVDWDTIIPDFLSWSTFVPTIAWKDWIPDFPGWPSPGDILNALIGNGPKDPAEGDENTAPAVNNGDAGNTGQPPVDPTGTPVSTEGAGGLFGIDIKGFQDLAKNMNDAATGSGGISGALEAVKQAFEDLKTAVSAALDDIQVRAGTFVAQITVFGTVAGNNFRENILKQMQTATTGTKAFFDAIQTFAGMLVGQLTIFGTVGGQQFQQNLMTGFQAATTGVTTHRNAIQVIVGGLVPQLGALAAAAGNAFTGGLNASMQNAVSAMGAWVSALRAIMASAGDGAFGSGYNIGDNFGSGLNQGIAKWASAVAATAYALVANAVAAGNSAQKSTSPAKETIQMGEDFGLGYVIGIKNLFNAAGGAAAGLVNNALSGIAGQTNVSLGALSGSAVPALTPVNSMITIGQLPSSQGNVFNIFQLKTQDFIDMQQNAEFAASFTRDLNTETQFRYPGGAS